MKLKKAILIISLVFLVLIISILMCIAITLTMTHLGYNVIKITVGCASVEDEETWDWDDEYPYYWCQDTKTCIDAIRKLKCEKTQDVLADVELIELSLLNSNHTELFNLVIAYDYNTQKTYILKNRGWYLLNNTQEFDDFIKEHLNQCGYSGFSDKAWKVQSLQKSEFPDADVNYDSLIFRYNVHWRSSETLTFEEDEYQNSGFTNTVEIPINTPDQAITQAAKEMEYDNFVGIAFYDKTCRYWMVELYDGELYTAARNSNEYGDFLYDNVYTVVMDNMGITLETYQHVTSFDAFRQLPVE